MLRRARLRAGLTQRQLATRAGVAQSTVGRIESGALDPRFATMARLLRGCGTELDAIGHPGEGVDRTQLREGLARTPRQRLEQAAAAAKALDRLRRAAR